MAANAIQNLGGDSTQPTNSSLSQPSSKSVTELPITKFSHQWIIKNFSLIPLEPVDRLNSPYFSPPNSPKDLWFLKLRLKAVDETDPANLQEYIGIHLFLRETADKKREVRAHYTISVIDIGGHTRFTGQCSKPEGRVFKSGTEGHGYKLLCPRSSILDSDMHLLGEDQSLNIRADVTVFGDLKSSSTHTVVPRFKSYDDNQLARYSIEQAFSSLYEKQKNCDFHLVAKDDIKIPCHRVVLAARSDYFERMLDLPTKEKQNNEVILEDIDCDVLKEMLRFMYTDEVPFMDRLACPLMVVADRFNLQKLKMMCEDHLLKKIDKTNVGDILVHADMSQSNKLREAALDFTADFSSDLIRSHNFKTTIAKRPHLFKDAFEKLAKKQKPNSL